HYHQAYRHGLLEHCLSVARAVSAISATFPGIDRDLAVTGALLHDIGKIEAYAMAGGAIELTDLGKLQGEIPLGYYTVRRAIEDIPGFPRARAGRSGVARRCPARSQARKQRESVATLTREANRPPPVHSYAGFPVAKDTEKLIRQLSLISFLMAERRPVTALEIKQEVEGYSGMNDDAFARRFYADRAELESLGIELKVEKPAEGYYEAENYTLPPENFYLPAIKFTDSELGALRTALS